MVFYIADSSDVEVTGTSGTATLVDSGVDVYPGQTFFLQGTAILNLDDKDCSQLPRFCATLSPATGASFTLTADTGYSTTTCTDITCQGLVIDAGGSITVSSGFLEDRSTIVEFDVVYRTSNAGVTGDNLWQLSVYASANSDGSGTQQSLQQVTLTSANSGKDITSIGADLSLTGLAVSMDFSGLYCADGSIMYLCTVLSKSPSASTDFELSSASEDGSEYTQCTAAPCSGLLITSVMPGSSDSILQNTNPSTITIDVDLAFSDAGGSASGDSLWNVEVFTSVSDTTITPVVTATVTVGTAANVDAVAGSSSTLSGITAVLDLFSVECVDAPFICVRISRGSSPTVNYDLDSSSNLKGCFVPDCLGVIVTSLTANIGDTPFITEYQTSSLDADFHLQIITDPSGGSAINPPNLFKVDVYVSGNSDCSGTKNALEAGTLPAVPTTLPAGHLQLYGGITASLDISALTCLDMEYLCADFQRNDGQTFTITPLINTAGAMMDCRAADECVSSPCENGATCSKLQNQYMCTCASGFTGDTCNVDINECLSNPCENGATCSNLQNQYMCTCVSGFTGDTCNVDINECVSNPCENGATCSNLQNQYTCTCASGFTGDTCNVDINECVSNPCENGGVCSDEVNRYQCSCPDGYSGTNCQKSSEDDAINYLMTIVLGVTVLFMVAAFIIFYKFCYLKKKGNGDSDTRTPVVVYAVPNETTAITRDRPYETRLPVVEVDEPVITPSEQEYEIMHSYETIGPQYSNIKNS